jgi:hypothetical protein
MAGGRTRARAGLPDPSADAATRTRSRGLARYILAATLARGADGGRRSDWCCSRRPIRTCGGRQWSVASWPPV